MHRLKKLIIVFFIFNGYALSAQLSYRVVDSLSYELYRNQQWEELTELGKQLTVDYFDYYYFNVRLGIAYFNLGEYRSSIKFLKRAYQNNSKEAIVKTYLFWCNKYLMREKQAKYWYHQMDEKTRAITPYQPLKKISSLYLESGLKISNKKESANDLRYGNISLAHSLSGRIGINHGYTYLDQKFNWGAFSQHQYYLNPYYRLSNTLKMDLGLHGAYYKNKVDLSTQYVYRSNGFKMDRSIYLDTLSRSRYKLNGNYSELDFYIQPRLTKEFKGLSIAPYFGYYYSKQYPKLKEHFVDTTTYQLMQYDSVLSTEIYYSDSIVTNDEISKYSQLEIGLSLYYQYKFLTIGGDMRYIWDQDQGHFFYQPYLKVAVNHWLSISAYYFEKKAYMLSLFGGSQFLNDYNSLQKINLTAEMKLNPNINLYLTYQNEQTTDAISKTSYNFNNAFLGVKFKF